MNRCLFAFGPAALLALFVVTKAEAQVTLDASKITCDQFVHHKIAPARTVGAWLSGYYSGKRDAHVLDTQTFETNLTNLEAFCYDQKNWEIRVMDAIEKLRK